MITEIRKVSLSLCLLGLSLCTEVQAQQAGDIIRGRVTDAMGPVIMANVVEIDAANRIVAAGVTDMNGNFSFKIKNPKDRIKVSFVGYKTKILPIKGTVYNISLEDKSTLKDVTVTAKRRAQGSDSPYRRRRCLRHARRYRQRSSTVLPSPPSTRRCRDASPVSTLWQTRVTSVPERRCVCVVCRASTARANR